MQAKIRTFFAILEIEALLPWEKMGNREAILPVAESLPDALLTGQKGAFWAPHMC
jgi:hypothetical protein